MESQKRAVTYLWHVVCMGCGVDRGIESLGRFAHKEYGEVVKYYIAAWNKTRASMGSMCAVGLILEAQYQQMTNQVTCKSVFAHSSKLKEVVVVAKFKI